MSLSRRHFLGTCAATMLVVRYGFADSMTSKTLRVALISDTHTNREIEGDASLYRARFDAVIEDVNAQKVDLILLGGDLTEGGKPETIADFKAQCLKLSAPQLYVAGNHDVGAKKVEGKTSNLSDKRVTSFEAEFGPAFWEREIGGARIVGVNASLFGSGLEHETAQWEFLEKAFAKEVGTPFGTHLLTHYPLFLKSPDEPSDPYWNIESAPRARLLALLKQAKVRGVFSGHIHRPLFNESDGIAFITTPPVSFGLPRGKQPQGWTLLTIAQGGQINHQIRSIAL